MNSSARFSHVLRAANGYDLVSHVIGFCRSLREDGLLVGPSETADAIRSLSLVDLMDRDQVYWAFRTILVSRMDETAAFDDCFRRFWTFQSPQVCPDPRGHDTPSSRTYSGRGHTLLFQTDPGSGR